MLPRLLTSNSFCRSASQRLPQPALASTSHGPSSLLRTLTTTQSYSGRGGEGRFERRERPARGGDRDRERERDRGDESWEGRRESSGRTGGGDLGSWLERRSTEREVERRERASARAYGDPEDGPRPRRGDRRDRDRDGSGSGPRGGDASGLGYKLTRDRRREEGRPATLKETMQGTEVLYGVSAVLAALEAGRRRPYRLLVQDSLVNGLAASEGRKDLQAIERARQYAEERGAAVVIVEKHDLNCLVDNRPHQGLALDCSALECGAVDAPPSTTSRFEGRAFPLWLALDEVTDPQNLGAIVRSAFFLGADGVLLCSKNSAPLGGVASKASAGALEHFEQVRDVYNMPRYLERCREEGWSVIGADAGSDAKDVRQLQITGPTVLVMGSEGYGLRTNVRRACSEFAMITSPLAARELKSVDSLNVSVATACLLHELLGKIGK